MARPRLTPHQREVHARIERYAARPVMAGKVPADWIGSRGAVAHLVAKGYVELVAERPGPRGGERWSIRPLPELEPAGVASCDECGSSEPHDHPQDPTDVWYPLLDGTRG